MRIVLSLFVSVLLWSTGAAKSQDWKKVWDDTVAAAKKEGRITIVGAPESVMRSDIIPRFTERFGIAVEYIAGSSGQIAGRVRTERQSGIYSVDVYMSGAGTTLTVLHPEKMIDPVKPLLILPEVIEGKYWKPGQPTFADKDKESVLMLFKTVEGFFFINTDHVKPEEVRNATDLLNPKFKGKFSAQDPLASGSGNSHAVHYFVQMGADFTKKLYVDQKPTFSRNRRQLTDWLGRGTQPICLGCRPDDVAALQKEGFKLHEVHSLGGMTNRVNPSPFMLSMANKAPHPNAARVFMNWMATREPLEIYSRFAGAATLRTDVDESFLNPEVIPKPGVAYQDDTDHEWVAVGRKVAGNKVRELLRAKE